MRYSLLYKSVFLSVVLVCFSEVAMGSSFVERLAKAKNQNQAISIASKEIQDTKSKHRIKAIEYLRAAKATQKIEFLKQYVKDRDIQTFVLYAFGDLMAFEATDILIDMLDHPNQNVGANAFKALGKIFPLELPSGYAYNQTPIEKRKYKKLALKWWKSEGPALSQNFKRNLNPGSQESQVLWDTYGKGYLQGK